MDRFAGIFSCCFYSIHETGFYFYDNIFTGNSYAFNSHNNFVGGLGITREFPEKRFSYGHYGYTSPNFHAATNALAAVAPRNHMRGNLDFAVTFNNYNGGLSYYKI